MKIWVNVALIIACSLAGSKSLFSEPGEIKQCLSDVLECKKLDDRVTSTHISTPIILVCVAIFILGMPTLLIPCKMRDAGIVELCKSGVIVLLSYLIAVWLDRRMLSYSIIMHSCVRSLCSIRPDHLVGGSLWISLRYVFVWALLCWAVHYGPGISIVQWMDASQTLCAYQCHLAGVLFAGQIDEVLEMLFDFFTAIHIG